MTRKGTVEASRRAGHQQLLKISHIICSRNRATQLQTALARFDVETLRRSSAELILVDSSSTDDTFRVMDDVSQSGKGSIKVVHLDRPGLGRARNAGVAVATGDLLVFTDDDCYIEEGFHNHLQNSFDSTRYHYGMGQVLLWDRSDDPRIANKRIPDLKVIGPGMVLPAGAIQGANMFVLREVFAKVGGFREDMGAGTAFPCEDIEFATRCSLAGFTGVLLPQVCVFHHHGKKPGTPESEATLHGYDFGRGAYYASLIARGVTKTWDLWMRRSQTGANLQDRLARLEREFKGAADYMRQQMDSTQKPQD